MIRHYALVSFLVFGAFVLSAAAQIDQTFGTGGKTAVASPGNDIPLASFVLPDGKLLVVAVNEFTTYYFLRFQANGLPDTSYGTNGRVTLSIPFNNSPDFRYLGRAIRQTDGKVVIVGRDGDDSMIIRFNETGTLDTTFSDDGMDRPNLKPDGFDYFQDLFQQSDGKLMVGANLASDAFSAVRYQPDGTPDPTFGPAQGHIAHPGTIWSISPQTNGKYLFFAHGHAVYRLNADGALDNSFSVPSLASSTFQMLVLASQKFLVLEDKFASDEVMHRDLSMIVRGYNADGTPDTGFGTNGSVYVDVASNMRDESLGIVEQPDGKILIAAKTIVEDNRTSFKGPYLSLVKMNPDGSIIGKYLVTPTEADFGLLSFQADGKIVATSSVAGVDRDVVLVRLTDVPLVTYRFHGIPFQFRYLGVAAPSVFRPAQNKWYLGMNESDEVFLGLPGDIPVPSDYMGDWNGQLHSEVAVFRPSTGTWLIRLDPANFANQVVSIRWGMAGDIPVPADYDGDAKSDVAVFRPSEGVWYIRNGSDNSFRFEHWGLARDKPVAGDYDGDGFYDVAVWRPSDGVWYILRSSDHQPYFVHFGMDGDIPVQEDYDGDGKFDIAVWRPSTGMWYIQRSSDGGFTYFNWGLDSDVPVPADYDGDRKADISVWRSSSRVWYINYSSGIATTPFIFGASTDIPLPRRQ